MSTSSDHWSTENIPELQGKRALITGGAGGLGLATATALASRGAEVIVADINETSGKRVAQHLPGKAVFRKLDLANLRIA